MSEKNVPFPEIKILSDAAFNINNQIFLLGAKHFSPEHIALVEDQLQYIQPDVLMIQMDQESYNTLHHFYAQFHNKNEIIAYLDQKAFISHLSQAEQIALIQFSAYISAGLLPNQEFLAPAKYLVPNNNHKTILQIREMISESLYDLKFKIFIASGFVQKGTSIITVLLCYGDFGFPKINEVKLAKKAHIKREQLDEYINYYESLGIIHVEKHKSEKEIRLRRYFSINRDSNFARHWIFNFVNDLHNNTTAYELGLYNIQKEGESIDHHRYIYGLLDDLFFLDMTQIEKIRDNARTIIRSNIKTGKRLDIPTRLSQIEQAIPIIDPGFHSILDKFKEILHNLENEGKCISLLEQIPSQLFTHCNFFIFRTYRSLCNLCDHTDTIELFSERLKLGNAYI